MFQVNLIVDDNVISRNVSEHNFRKTLRLAWELLGGIPSAECVIRRNGDMVGYLRSDFRGEMAEAEVHVHFPGKPYGHVQVTELNPHGPIFQGVFAS